MYNILNSKINYLNNITFDSISSRLYAFVIKISLASGWKCNMFLLMNCDTFFTDSIL